MAETSVSSLTVPSLVVVVVGVVLVLVAVAVAVLDAPAASSGSGSCPGWGSARRQISSAIPSTPLGCFAVEVLDTFARDSFACLWSPSSGSRSGAGVDGRPGAAASRPDPLLVLVEVVLVVQDCYGRCPFPSRT